MSLQHGFKALAARTTADVRDELGLNLYDRLDPLDLCPQWMPSPRDSGA